MLQFKFMKKCKHDKLKGTKKEKGKNFLQNNLTFFLDPCYNETTIKFTDGKNSHVSHC